MEAKAELEAMALPDEQPLEVATLSKSDGPVEQPAEVRIANLQARIVEAEEMYAEVEAALARAEAELESLRSQPSQDVRAAMIRAQDSRRTVTLQGITVEYSPDEHVSESNAYRLAEKVRGLMLREGLLVRGDFVIKTEKPR